MDVLSVAELRESATEVNIVYTTPEATRTALLAARSYSKQLKVRVRVLAFQIVPYPLNIDEPDVSNEFAIDQILTALTADPEIEFSLEYFLCRDPEDALIRYLESPTIVVIAGRSRLFPSKEQRLARRLSNLGHQVVFIRR